MCRCSTSVRLILIMSLGHGLNHSFLLFFSPLLLSIGRDLGLSDLEVGSLAGLAWAAYGLGALPAGLLADRIGHRRAAVLSFCVPVLGCLIAAVGGGIVPALVGFLLIGLGAGAYHPAGFALVVGLADAEHRGKALGLHGVGGNLGMAAAPFLAARAAASWGWRGSFTMFAGLGLAFALLLKVGLPPDRQPRRQAPQSRNAVKPRVLLETGIVLVFLLLAIHGFINDGVFAYLPTFLQEEMALPVVLSAAMHMLQLGVGASAQMAGGILSDKLGRRNTMLLGTCGCIAAFALLPALPGGPGGGLTCLLVLMGFCLFLLQPPVNALIADLTPESLRGSTYGAVFAAKYGVGALAPVVAGAMAGSHGLNIFFYLMAFMMALTLPLVLFAPTEMPSGSHQVTAN